MESVCEVVGFECVYNQDTGEETGVRIYATRPLSSSAVGEGTETIREYVSGKYVDYKPTIGDHIVFLKNARGYVDRVIKF